MVAFSGAGRALGDTTSTSTSADDVVPNDADLVDPNEDPELAAAIAASLRQVRHFLVVEKKF